MQAQCFNLDEPQVGNQYTKWHDYDYVYQFNDFLVQQVACPTDWDYYKEYVQDISPCKKDLFQFNGISQDYLEYMMYIETKFSGGFNQTDATEVEEKSSISDQIMSFSNSLYNYMDIFQVKQCQGFCQKPNHLLFSIDKEGEEVPSCSEFIIEYLNDLALFFLSITSNHLLLCYSQMGLLIFQYFFIPARKQSSLQYEKAKISREEAKWQKRLDKKQKAIEMKNQFKEKTTKMGEKMGIENDVQEIPPSGLDLSKYIIEKNEGNHRRNDSSFKLL